MDRGGGYGHWGSQGVFRPQQGLTPSPGKKQKCIPPLEKFLITPLTECICRYLDRYFLVIDEISTRQYDVLTGRSGGL